LKQIISFLAVVTITFRILLKPDAMWAEALQRVAVNPRNFF